jgi:hypothetical protein
MVSEANNLAFRSQIVIQKRDASLYFVQYDKPPNHIKFGNKIKATLFGQPQQRDDKRRCLSIRLFLI